MPYPQLTLHPAPPLSALSRLSATLHGQTAPLPAGSGAPLFPFRSIIEVAREFLQTPDEIELNPLDLLRLISAKEDELKRAHISTKKLAIHLWQYLIKRPIQLTTLLSRAVNNELAHQLFQTPSEELWLNAPLKGQLKLESDSTLHEIFTVMNQPNLSLAIVKAARQAGETPWRWLRYYGISLRRDIMKKLIGYTVKALEPIKTLNAQDAQWLCSCMAYAEDIELKVSFADELLRALPSSVDRQEGLRPLVQWFKQEFDRRMDSWKRLKPESQKRLVDWLGELAYGDFLKLIRQVAHFLEKKISNSYNTEMVRTEINHLHKRGDFWSIYKKSFARMRVLFPVETIQSIQSDFQHLLNVCQVEIIGQGEAIEVAIFEINQFIIAEIFRGVVSEIIFFKNEDFVSGILFNESIGIDLLRVDERLAPYKIKIFDHKYLWQTTVQRWLFSHNVFVDQGVSKIPGLHKKIIGGQLPIPEEDELQGRAHKIDIWERDHKKALALSRVRYTTPK